jgi:hypothetical protein
MVLLEIHGSCLSLPEFECDAPWTIHVNGVTNRTEATKRMEVEARDVQILAHSRPINDIQPSQEPSVHASVYLACRTGFPKLTERTIPEAQNHSGSA